MSLTGLESQVWKTRTGSLFTLLHQLVRYRRPADAGAAAPDTKVACATGPSRAGTHCRAKAASSLANLFMDP